LHPPAVVAVGEHSPPIRWWIRQSRVLPFHLAQTNSEQTRRKAV
jgi:hypothetical protein